MLNKDKALHFIVGVALAPLSIWFVMVIALGKEIYDYYNPEKHTADWNDFIATVVGGLVGLQFWSLI